MRRMLTIVLVMTLVIAMCACSQEEEKPLREEDIRAICDLATLECYYNNVAEIEKKADNIFQKDRKMWIEYEGKATIGIKMSDVVISIEGDTVQITMPNADILSTDYRFFEDAYVSSEDGWLVKNEISTEEQRDAVIEAQEVMVDNIKKNADLFRRAEDRAKELIENYINKMGEVTGKEYTIKWINA